jgi:uncharacterized repeat protein (TIGR01451 family)
LQRFIRRLRIYLLPLAVACALAAGCAGLRCPRIDPSGERCLIWPKDELRTPVAAAPIANPTAPPVLTDPVFPAPPAIAAPTSGTIATPAAVPIVQGPQDALSISPQRVLAPVGSEVVLKASICTTEGYTLADQKVEWMLGRNGVGQFVEVGGRGLFHPPIVPWNSGAKVDNYLANGYTANGPLCITRGTADPSDDLNINRGDAWISVTSPNEGTSHVTAFTPAVESWDQRKSAATIYWVDVQWTFPPASMASSGRGETLTTVVTRHTDGTPLAGWIVSYTVSDGGEPREVATGPDGRASVQVAPTASGAPESRIDMQLIRPAGLGGGDAPPLVVAQGATTIRWGGGDYLPPASAQPLPTAPPSEPPTTTAPPSSPITPQPQLPAAGAARLELDVTAAAPQVTVGGSVQFKVVIRNVGDAPATAVKLSDSFPPGLTFPDDPASDEIAYNVGTIGPRQSRQIDLPFQVSKAGQLCHQVKVEYAEGSPVTRQSCVTAVAAAPGREAGLKVEIDGPAQGVVGQTATFRVTVRNTGEIPLVNINTIEEYPTGIFQPQPADPNVQVVSGTISRAIARLDVGQVRQYDVPCLLRQATRGTVVVRGAAETDPPSYRIENNDDHSIDIQAVGAQPPPSGPSVPPTGQTSLLGVRVTFVNPQARVGAATMCQVAVANRSTTVPQEQVALRVYFPAELTPDVAAIKGPPTVQVSLAGDVLTFTPLVRLAPGETVLYQIPISPKPAAIAPVTAQAVSSTVREGVSHTENLEILGNRL